MCPPHLAPFDVLCGGRACRLARGHLAGLQPTGPSALRLHAARGSHGGMGSCIRGGTRVPCLPGAMHLRCHHVLESGHEPRLGCCTILPCQNLQHSTAEDTSYVVCNQIVITTTPISYAHGLGQRASPAARPPRDLPLGGQWPTAGTEYPVPDPRFDRTAQGGQQQCRRSANGAGHGQQRPIYGRHYGAVVQRPPYILHHCRQGVARHGIVCDFWCVGRSICSG